MPRYARIAASTALAAGFAVAAQAQPAEQMVCGKRDHLVSHLGQAYSEAPSNLGLAATGNIVEVLTSTEGTWTILVTEPSGVTCVVAAGESWETLPRTEPRVALGPSF